MFFHSRFSAGLALICCLIPCLFLCTGCSDSLSGSSRYENSASADIVFADTLSFDTLSSGYEVYSAGDRSRQTFSALSESLFLQEVQADTLTLHYHLANPSEYGITESVPSLGDYTKADFDSSIENARSYLSALQAISREDLSSDQQITYDIMEDSLTLSLEYEPYYYYREPLGPATGLQAQLPILLAEYHFRNEQDILDYLALCEDLPRYFEQLLIFEQEKAAAGFFMSDSVLDSVLAQCSSFCEDPENHFMLTAFVEALEKAEWLTDIQKLSYRSKNREVIITKVIPAYQALATGLEALRGQGKNAMGLCYLPDGTEYYRLLVHSATGSSRTVEEMIALVNRQLISDVQTMTQIYEAYPELSTELEQSFTLTEPESILIDLQSKMRNDFPVLSGVSCQVKYVPASLEEHVSPAFYLVPPMDAMTENCIYINQATTDTPKLYTTLAHEGYPGHLYQTVYSASCQTDPLRNLLSYKGYSEGWATYVERLAYSYEDSFSPQKAEFLTCNARAILALYALCDMNIHLNGWSRTETWAFLRTWIPDLDSHAVDEIYEAVLAAPANYLSYHVGAMEWETLRAEAEERLGDVFDLKEFHTFVLQMGECSFDVLRKYMEEWMKIAAGA